MSDTFNKKAREILDNAFNKWPENNYSYENKLENLVATALRESENEFRKTFPNELRIHRAANQFSENESLYLAFKTGAVWALGAIGDE